MGFRAYGFTFWREEDQILVIALQWLWRYTYACKEECKKKRRKGERKVQEVQVGATAEERGRRHLWTLLVLEEEGIRKARGVFKKIKVWILV